MMNAMGEITTDDEFAAHVDAFFDETVPRVLAEAGSGLERAKAWRRALHDAGLSGLDYPVAIGGQEASESRRRIYKERSAGRIPTEDGTFGIGIGMVLPVVRDHGTDALKAAVVERGLRGDDIWCQLYSEPGAGSDLASLATKAERDGDEWVVTGQKVWTSGAQNADLAILLVRTDPEAPKHRGITMLVLPMNQDGVTVRPLRQMTGEAEFNEVFIDEARCPSEWVVGDVNDGWRMAVALLAHERVQTGVASTTGASGSRSKRGRVPVPVDDLIGLARSTDRVDDPLVRQELAALHTGEEIIRFLRGRGTHPSIGKLWRTRQGRRAAALGAQLSFPGGVAWETGDVDPDWFAHQVMNCRGMSLGGGTDEIQRNTLGERALGLPREPSVDRDVPFRELRVGTQRSS